MSNDDQIDAPALGLAHDLLGGMADQDMKMCFYAGGLDTVMQGFQDLMKMLFRMFDDGFGFDLAAEFGWRGHGQDMQFGLIFCGEVER